MGKKSTKKAIEQPPDEVFEVEAIVNKRIIAGKVNNGSLFNSNASNGLCDCSRNTWSNTKATRTRTIHGNHWKISAAAD